MTDLSITATSVVPGNNANIVAGIFGAAVTAGQVVYKEAATGLLKLADSNSATAEARTPYGIALNGGSTGQAASVIRSGDVTIGATLVAGMPYFLSETPGGIEPVADLGTGEYSAQLGTAKTTAILTVKINAPGVVLA